MGSLNPVALRVIRECRGMSGAELARAIGISQGHYSHLERGSRQASTEIINALSAQLGVPVAALVNWCSKCRGLKAA